MENKPDSYIGKIIRINENLRGKCIGNLPESGELIYIHDKGGRLDTVKMEEIKEIA